MEKLIRKIIPGSLFLTTVGVPLTAYALSVDDLKSILFPLEAVTDIYSILWNVLVVLLAVAGIIALMFLVIGGVRYITAGGNPDAVAAAKTTILNAVIGVVVIFIAWAILWIIRNTLLGVT